MTTQSSQGFTPPPEQRPAISVDVIIFNLDMDNNDLKTLLIRRRNPPFVGMWAVPGGFLRYGEALDEAARRKLDDETGVTDVYLEQLFTFGSPARDPRGHVITVTYFALVPNNLLHLTAGPDTTEAALHSVYSPPPLAFDHQTILAYALQRLRYKLEYTAAGFELLPSEFTLSDLQQAYEIVLGETLDKRNFQRRILEAGVIEETAQVRTGRKGPRPMLYRYRQDASPEIKARRLFP